MEHPKVSPEEMMKRIVRFENLKENGIPLMFIDSILPGHHRMNYAVIGDTASENPEFTVKRAIDSPHKFQIGMCMCMPGCGPGLHTHDYIELFMPLDGEFQFDWSNENTSEKLEGSQVLGPWDMISFPPGLWRSFRNVSDHNAWFFAVLEPHTAYEGKDPYWSPEIIHAAEEKGFRANEKGKMVKPDNYNELAEQMRKKILGED